MDEVKKSFIAGLKTGVYVAGVVVPVAAVMVVASWFKAK